MARHLLEEERVAAGLSVRGRRPVRGERAVRRRRPIRSAPSLADAAQLDPVHVDVAAEIGAQVGERVGPARPESRWQATIISGVPAVAHHVRGRSSSVGRSAQCRSSSTSRVRLGGRDPGDERGHRLEEPVAVGLRVLGGRSVTSGIRGSSSGNARASSASSPWIALAERGDRETPRRRSERLDERLVGDDDLLVAPAVQSETRPAWTRAASSADEPRLADAGLAADERDPTVAGRGIGPRRRAGARARRRGRELRHAERRPGHVSVPGTRPPSAAAGSRTAPRSRLEDVLGRRDR